MGNRLTKIYTRTGDDGTTGLGDGSRIHKTSLRIRAIGDVDELNSLAGLLAACEISAETRSLLLDIQHTLFDIGGELSLPGQSAVTDVPVQYLEDAIDRFNMRLPPLKEFILPGGSIPAAICHLARAVCRRAERSLIRLHETESLNKQVLIYLNRLSDLFFVLARALARESGGREIYWEKGRPDR